MSILNYKLLLPHFVPQILKQTNMLMMDGSNPSPSTKPTSTRVILWSNPRCLSTVFLKAMNKVDSIQLICELYESAYEFGPERNLNTPNDVMCEKVINAQMDQFSIAPRPNLYDDDICTYEWVRNTMQSEFPGKSVIFAKEFPFSIEGRYDLLPEGYRHTFLIRQPAKCFASLKRVIDRIYDTPIPLDCGHMARFKTMYELMEHTRHNGQPNPVVIDADDLQRHPESILRQYCQATSIPYDSKLLQWDAGDELLHTMVATKKMLLNGMIKDGGYFADAFRSTKINPPTTNGPSSSSASEEMSEDLKNAIESNQPFYDMLYALRIKP